MDKKLRPNRRTGIYKNCLQCKTSFYLQAYRIKDNPKYCSSKCYGISKLNKSPWNKGLKNIQGANDGSFIKIKTNFKGTISQYKALHYKIGKLLGKPSICQSCGKTGLKGRLIHWANISGYYSASTEDWIRLCRPCHFKFDNVEERRAKNARNIL